MGVQVWWPLAFLALVPVILLLYFLKQNVKKKKFSAVMLWQEAYRQQEAAKPWEKLRKNILLILQIIAILLFVLALMHPWISSIGKEKGAVVLVLDTSAGMDTLYEGEKTRLDEAKERACAYVDDQAAGSTFYVISGSAQAVLELSGSQDKTEAKRTIQNIEQTTLGGDLSYTLGLVQSCLNQADDTRVVFFTDTAFDRGDLEARVESVYSEAENMSLDSVTCSISDGKLLTLIQASNHGSADQGREVNLYAISSDRSETLLQIGNLTIPAGESVSSYLEVDADEIPDGTAALRAQLQDGDALAGDDESWCVLEEEQQSSVLLYTQSNVFLEKAFSNISGAEVYRTADAGVFDTESAQAYDLYIFDGMLPEQLPENGNYFFVNCMADEITSVSGSVTGSVIDILQTDITPYSGGVSFGVNAAQSYDLPAWGTSLIASADEQVIGFYGTGSGHRIAVMGFDLHDTDFGLQAEFPILISELSDYLLDGELTEKTSYTAGESILLHGSTSGSEMQISNPDGSQDQIPVSEAAGSYLTGQNPGLYRVSQQQNGEEKEQWFAVQFPTASESETESAQSMAQSEDQTAHSPASSMDLDRIFLIVLLCFMGAEWLIYVILNAKDVSGGRMRR